MTQGQTAEYTPPGEAQGKTNDAPPPPERKPLLTWHEAKKTKRDVLCLAVVDNMWDFRQEPNTFGETLLTEAEFDAAILKVTRMYEGLMAEHGATRPSQLPILMHHSLLLAMVVRRPKKAEMDQLYGALRDDKLPKGETEIRFQADLVGRAVFPKSGTAHMAYLMEEAPAALFHVFPQQLFELMGADRISSKKLG